ncbi:SH3 domain-containing protein [Mesorhizobium sp. NZP2234]|uniref:SH3 domain-containing protein n=1 Tax=Mesorhizobium sp. NZP2234 TaxID=2483402 RepID=UPI001553CEAD|nr:SH3 domain-containing protein [Mesorhizobium sp. NZP2234]QKC89115.1 SH3 domain-containing protein [Mesorhizobium sp. NZP2234]
MKRRTVTLRKSLHALIAAPLLMAAWPAVVPALAEEAPFISIVTGLAPDDLLNIRAKPSAIGKTETRLAAGASVRNLGCNDIDGHPWCKVVSDNPKATGWAPARYLVPVNPATVPDPDQAADAPTAASAAADPAMPADGDPAAVAPPAAQASSSATPPPDLTARLGGAAQPVAPEAPVKSAATIAMQDAYGLALVASETPSTGEIPVPDGEAGMAADSGSAGGSLPVPTPRPESADAAPAVDTQTVAELPPQPAALATGGTLEIPCARYVGQPMTPCAATVVHKGADKADVTVTWPDGGTRVISFYAGLPAGSNAKNEFRFTREGSLSMIRIGVSERFEITDTVAFGH